MIAAVVPNLDKKDTDRCTRALVKKLHSLGADVWMAETMRPYFGDTGVGFLKDENALYRQGDVLIAVGGDGTIIRVRQKCRVMRKSRFGYQCRPAGVCCQFGKGRNG